jgi:hypothetical protein
MLALYSSARPLQAAPGLYGSARPLQHCQAPTHHRCSTLPVLPTPIASATQKNAPTLQNRLFMRYAEA